MWPGRRLKQPDPLVYCPFGDSRPYHSHPSGDCGGGLFAPAGTEETAHPRQISRGLDGDDCSHRSLLGLYAGRRRLEPLGLNDRSDTSDLTGLARTC